MKLSMWILADWLKKYNPVANIYHGKLELQYAQLFAENHTEDRRSVYIGRSRDFIPSLKDEVILVHEKDTIFLDTSDIEEVLNEVLYAFNFYNDWYLKQQNNISSGCTLQELISDNYFLFNTTMVLLDSSYYISATEYLEETLEKDLFFKNSLEDHYMPLEKLVTNISKIQKMLNCTTPYLIKLEEDFTNEALLVNLFHNNEHSGWLTIINHTSEFTQAMFQFCEILGQLIENWIDSTSNRNELLDIPTLLKNYLSGQDTMSNRIINYFEIFDWKYSDTKILVKISSVDYSANLTMPLYSHISNDMKPAYSFIYEESLIIINNLKMTDKNNFLKKLNYWLIKGNFYCGISYDFLDIKLLEQSYVQATIALEYGICQVGKINYCETYVLNYISKILSQNSNIDLKHPAIAVIKAYDNNNNTEFLNTLKTYILCDCNQLKAAEKLNLHRNSLIYRLKRIDELIPIDFYNVNVKAHLLLSFLS